MAALRSQIGKMTLHIEIDSLYLGLLYFFYSGFHPEWFDSRDS